MLNKLFSYVRIETPTILSPTIGAITLNRTPTLVASNFSIVGSTSHFSTDWQISDSLNFGSIRWQSIDDTVNLTSITTTELQGGDRYVRVRYKGSNGYYSSWSPVLQFTSPWAYSVTAISTFVGPTEFVVPITSDITLQPGQYTIELWGAGGGGSEKTTLGGGGGLVVKEIGIANTTTIPFAIGYGGSSTTGRADSNTSVGGLGGSNGGGNGSNCGSSIWNGAGGGGSSNYNFNSFNIIAAGGGGGAGDVGTNGSAGGNSSTTRTYEWYEYSPLLYSGDPATSRKYAGGKREYITYKGTKPNYPNRWFEQTFNGGVNPISSPQISKLKFRIDINALFPRFSNSIPGFTASFEARLTNTLGGSPLQTFSFNKYWGPGKPEEVLSYESPDITWNPVDGTPILEFWYVGNTIGDVGFEIKYDRGSISNVGSSDFNFKENYIQYGSVITSVPNTNSGIAGDGGKGISCNGSSGVDGGGGGGGGGPQGGPVAYGGDGGTNIYQSGDISIIGSGKNSGSSTITGQTYYYSTGGYIFGTGGGPGPTSGKNGGAIIRKIINRAIPNLVITSNIPTTYSASAGHSNLFNVSVNDIDNVGNVTTYFYQWYLSTDGTNYSPILGEINATLSRYSIFYFSDNTHKIKCIITGTTTAGSTSVTSNICTLNISRNTFIVRTTPILPATPNYILNGRNDTVGFNISDFNDLSEHIVIQNIPVGKGRLRIQSSTDICSTKRSVPIVYDFCETGSGYSWSFDVRLAVIQNGVKIWSGYERNLKLSSQDLVSLDFNSTSMNGWHPYTGSSSRNGWYFDSNDTINLDPLYPSKLVVQFKRGYTDYCTRCNPPGSVLSFKDFGSSFNLADSRRRPGIYRKDYIKTASPALAGHLAIEVEVAGDGTINYASIWNNYAGIGYTVGDIIIIPDSLFGGNGAPDVRVTVASVTTNNVTYDGCVSGTLLTPGDTGFRISAPPTPSRITELNSIYNSILDFAETEYTDAKNRGYSDCEIRYYIQYVYPNFPTDVFINNRLYNSNWGTDFKRFGESVMRNFGNDSKGSPYGSSSLYFGQEDYDVATSQGYSDDEIRYYLTYEYLGVLGPYDLKPKFQNINWGTGGLRVATTDGYYQYEVRP